MTRIRQRNKSKNGSVLILALIMASILLSVGMGISNIALKEIKLSSIGNESGKAFYMADSGIECALYWDIKNPRNALGQIVFATSTSGNPTATSPVYCLNEDIKSSTLPKPFDEGDYPGSGPFDPPYHWSRFWLLGDVGDGDINKPCAEVLVTKIRLPLNIITTTIDSYGVTSCNSSALGRIERALQVSY